MKWLVNGEISWDFIAGLLLGGVSRFAGRGGHGGISRCRGNILGTKHIRRYQEKTQVVFLLCSIFGISVNIC